MDSALLTGSDADCLSVLDVAYRVTLSVLQSDECNHKVALSLVCKVLVVGWNVGEKFVAVKFNLVSALFECNAETLLAFYRIRNVCRVYFYYVVCAFAFFF